LKKFVLVLLLVIVLAGGGFYYYQYQTKPQDYPVASDFMPAREDLSNLVLLGVEDLGSMMESVAEGIDLAASGLGSILPGGGSVAAEMMMATLTGKLHETAANVGDMQLLFSARPNGLIMEPSFWGAFALKGPDPGPFIDHFMDDLALSDPDLVIIPYTAEFPSGVETLYQVMDIDTGVTIYTVLYYGEPSYLLIASGKDELEKMIAAAGDPMARLKISRHYDEKDFLYAELDNRIFEALLENQGRSVQSAEPFMVEGIFFSEGRDMVMKMYSNGASLFLTPEETRSLLPVSQVDALTGGGKILGFLLTRMIGFTEDYINAMLSGQEAARASAALEFLEQKYGITVQDLVDLLNGEAMLVLGGKAVSPIGEIPGLYLVIKPVKKDITGKFASVVDVMNIPLPFRKIDAPGWEQVYAWEEIFTFTLAFREGELLLGVLDPGEISTAGEIPENISPFLTREHYGLLALSVRDLVQTLDEMAERMQALGPGPSAEIARKVMGDILRKVETFSCISVSLEESELRLTFIEESSK